MTVCGEKITGVCVAAKCPHFKRCCPVVWDKYGKTKPQTNEEWLRQCTTKQLAEWIAKIVDCDCCPVKRKFCDDNPCKIRFVEWLKEKHTNG